MNKQRSTSVETQSETEQPTRSRKLKPTRGLIILNIVLLAGLGLVTVSPDAGAQLSGQANTRVRGDYSVVGGATIGGVSSVLYVLDTANRELVALSWNDSTQSLEGIGYRDLDADVLSDPDR
ncbi:MAG: hypothetical protein P1U42_06080 [Phycisphaerales bacterium]|nr:hypothetical protein [Phycisphaerales bacterium]